MKGVEIILISNNGQVLDLSQLTSLGCDPKHKSTVFVKSNHHFRAAFGEITKPENIYTVNGGGLGSLLLNTVDSNVYKSVRRPIWPLDNIVLHNS